MEVWAGAREKLMNLSFMQTPFALSDWCEVVLEYVRPHTSPPVPSVLPNRLLAVRPSSLLQGTPPALSFVTISPPGLKADLFASQLDFF